MRKLTTMLALSAALLIAAALLPGAAVDATHPSDMPRPLLECADINADGTVSVGEIGIMVAMFGDPPIHPMYEVSTVDGSMSVGEIGAMVADFGRDCKTNEPDTEIAQATLWVIEDNPGLLTENPVLLNSMGYFAINLDVPGQGIHYVNLSATVWDGVFKPTEPEGLVYNNGALVAHLYYVNGDPATGGVGWGPQIPPPPDQNEIDAFCTPVLPNTACSWAGPYDGWHVHQNLCRTWIGTPQQSLSIKPSAQACEDHQNSQPYGGDWTWNEIVGWMGHMWNHQLNPNQNADDVQGNGRFADCFPDPNGGVPPNDHWNAYNCPQ